MSTHIFRNWRSPAWLASIGSLPAAPGTPDAVVPGTSGDVPLYLLAPGASAGLTARVWHTRTVFLAVALTTVWLWAAALVAHSVWTDAARLAAVVAWIAAASAWLLAMTLRPTDRPFTLEIERW